mmetsp:Transcript_105049/g.182682  ORF Transcript_105049/g.182682 Transcript_105049/m.182682 type:complete len:730 (+) Transcript_105049:83-2272(+)
MPQPSSPRIHFQEGCTPRLSSAQTSFEDLLGALRSEHERVLRQYENMLLMLRSGMKESREEHDPDSWHSPLPTEGSLPHMAARETRTCTSPRTPEPCSTPRSVHVEEDALLAAPRSPPDSVDGASIQTIGAASIQTLGAASIQSIGALQSMGAESSTRRVGHDSSLQYWQQHLVDIFKELDVDSSGSLNTDELRSALLSAGVPQARLQKLLKVADADGSGEIELSEWIRVVANSSEMVELSKRLGENLWSSGTVLKIDQRKKSRFMLTPHSRLRVTLDLILGVACMYTALVLPFVLAWEESFDQEVCHVFEVVEHSMTGMFLFDVILNFRTGYFTASGELTMDARKVACHYLRTWFFLDALSAFPFEATTSSANLQVLKILKLSRLLKIIKLSKMKALVSEDLSDFIDDCAHSKMGEILSRRYFVFLQMLLVCHWLACGMKIINEGFLTSNGGVGSEYLASLYWSMTTLTTVGYGDMVPGTDGERAFAIVAMVIGGAFYGYVVGATTSLVSNSDLNASAYYDRMALVHAWINHHRLPRDMARSLRRFFQACMHERAAVNEADIWHDLSPELQKAVGEYVIHENVRRNPLFDKMSMGAVVQVQSVLRKFTTNVGSVLTSKGEVGTAMYIVDSGLLEIKYGDEKVSKLGPGQSFGEEVLLGFTEEYAYTVIVLEEAHLEMILESEFLTAFQSLPNQLQRMRQNALDLNPQWEQPQTYAMSRASSVKSSGLR